MKQYLLFDLDGTLTDPMVGITSSVQYALEKFGIHVKYLKDLIPFIGPPLDDSFQEFYGLSKEDAGKAVEYYREYFAPKGIFENEVYPGIPEMLSRLVEAGFTLIVATSKPAVFAKRQKLAALRTSSRLLGWGYLALAIIFPLSGEAN